MTSASKAPSEAEATVRQAPLTDTESPAASSAASPALTRRRAPCVASPKLLDGADLAHDAREHPLTTPAGARGPGGRRPSAPSPSRGPASRRRSTAAPSPAASGLAPAPPSTIGAMKSRSSSTSPASRNEPARVGPPSSSSEVIPRRPSSASAAATRAGGSPSQTISSAPASAKRPRPLAAARRGDEHDQRRLADRADQPRAQRQTRLGVEDDPGGLARRRRRPRSALAVSSGSSASAVPMPTQTASHSARQRWTSARLASPEIHLESPPAVATRPSRLRADLSSTSGRPVRACFRNA